ncbi:MAG: alpha/beta hydrolase fold domain-containing protein [Saprospiraceae bacterium]|nr:alpha/beta hydrolase fold domain-containing protein [Saprospiraceae bacterium]
MMKYLIGLIIFLPHIIFSQNSCIDRYNIEIFPNIDSTLNILYGFNHDLYGVPINLYLDLYEPQGDTLNERPLIIFIHGGGYVQGTKTDPKITRLCTTFAKKGYVTASIDYRLGVDTSIGNTFFHSCLRSVHDANASIRYFIQNSNLHGIDTNFIFIGGCSAGALTSLHCAYMDNLELNNHISIDTSLFGITNNIAGNSGNSGSTSNIQAVINCWGAITDTLWIQPGDVPVLSIYGENDNTVPPGAGSHPLYANIALQGSKVIHSHCKNIGNSSFLKSYSNLGHGHSAYSSHMDTTIFLITNFLCNILSINLTALPNTNTKYYPLKIFHNYGTQLSNILFTKPLQYPVSLKLFDLNGKTVITDKIYTNSYNLNDKIINQGVYILHLSNIDESINKKIIIR